MDTMDYEVAWANLAEIMTKICDDHSPVIVTHKSGKSVVIMSLEDYESQQETDYLLNSRANARNLFESINELDK